MKKILIFIAFVILAFGCINQTQNSTHIKPTPLSFSRNTSNVLNSQTQFPTTPHFDFDKNSSGSLIVTYFYSPNCTGHLSAKTTIERLRARYDMFDWREYDITTQNGTLAYIQFAKQYNQSKDFRLVPQVLVAREMFSDSQNINQKLERKLYDLSFS